MTDLERMEQLWADVQERFPRARYLGICNRRPIAGTSIWSQHAYCNALDIGIPLVTEGVRYSWSGQFVYFGEGYDVGYGDEIRAFLRSRRLGTTLWRTRRHWDHIHVEGPVKRTGTPPPAGTITTPTTTGETMLKQPMAGAGVRALQDDLNAFRKAWGMASITVDGEYGPQTDEAVENFQFSMGLTVTGDADGVTLALLQRFRPASSGADAEARKAAAAAKARADSAHERLSAHEDARIGLEGPHRPNSQP